MLTPAQAPVLGPAHGAVLGLAQGLAEVLPVSSSAQLALLPWLLSWPEPADPTLLAAVLHAGSCAGIAWSLRRDIAGVTTRELAVIAAVTVPAAVGGLVVARRADRRLGSPRQRAALLAAGGLVHWLADRRAAVHDVRRGDAAVAALAQVLALAPGVSRSGAVLTALRAREVKPVPAQRFALLTALPVTAGAAALMLFRADRAALRATAGALVTGLPVAAGAAGMAAGLAYRRPAPVAPSALYRLGLAGLVVVRHRREMT